MTHRGAEMHVLTTRRPLASLDAPALREARPDKACRGGRHAAVNRHEWLRPHRPNRGRQTRQSAGEEERAWTRTPAYTVRVLGTE